MTAVTAALVKQLRDRTGAGMMDCKRALSESGGDLDTARDWLRAKGIASAQKKADRAAAEGAVGLVSEGMQAAMVEINSETDFVARNADFQALVAMVTRAALGAKGDLQALAEAELPGGQTVAAAILEAAARIGENIVLRRTACLAVESGRVGTYIHGAIAPGMGKIGAMVALESDAPDERLETLGRQLAMHVTAARPQAATPADLDPGVVDRERNILITQARESGKPEAIIEKMVEGRLRKFYEEAVLTEQVWVMDGESRVSGILKEAGRAAGSEIRVPGFDCFVLGEGVERRESDLAREVAETIGS